MSNEKAQDKQCDYNSFKRANYFHGMLMSENDFQDEQLYHNEKRKLLNRMLHGWGVVCGLEIIPTATPGPEVIIKPGLALDCAGNEIFLCKEYKLNVQEYLQAIAPDEKDKTQEEECKQMQQQQDQTQVEDKWYVVIRYTEVLTDRVPVYAPGGGCEERTCDYSRIREGFCLELTKTLPPQAAAKDAHPCPINPCDKPSVVLGSITIPQDLTNQLEITGEMIDNTDSRRFVLTFDMLQNITAIQHPGKTFIDLIIGIFSKMFGG